MRLSETEITQIRSELQHDAALFADPHAYLSGMEDTLAAVQRHLVGRDQDIHTMASFRQARQRRVPEGNRA